MMYGWMSGIRTMATMECTRCSELLIDSARELCCGCLYEGEAMEADAWDSGCSFMDAWSALLFSAMLLQKETLRVCGDFGQETTQATPALGSDKEAMMNH